MISLLLLAGWIGVAGQAPVFAQPGIDLKGRLYRAVFEPGPNTLSAADIALVSEPLRGRLNRFLTRRAEFKSQYDGTASDVAGVARDAKRRAIERAIVALIDVPDVAARAVAFVKAAPIAYEWEGKPQGPLAEAAFAEDTLKQDPKTPLAPFLYLFMAQRQRAASEAAERLGDTAIAKAAQTRYRELVGRIRSASDPIFGLLADDLERVPYVYVRPAKGL